MSNNDLTSQQIEFNNKYITSAEICEDLKVPRSMVYRAIERGMLPEALSIPGVKIFIWERDQIEENIKAWRLSLACARGERRG